MEGGGFHAPGASEDASSVAGGCPQSVESAVMRAFEMRRVPEEAVFGTEYLFRTVEACFLHRMPPKTRRVPQKPVFCTARIFRTVGGPIRYRMLDTEAGYRRSGAWRTFSRPLFIGSRV